MASDFDKPSSVEDEYFAREDIEKLHKLALKKAQEMAGKQKEELKKLHHNHCPNCGMDLHDVKRGRVDLSVCFNCQGMFLHKGALEQLIADREGFGAKLVDAVAGVFKRS